MKTIKEKVNLKDRSYEITIGNGVLALVEKKLEELSKKKIPIAIISEKNVWNNFLDNKRFQKYFHIVIAEGEKSKNFKNVQGICSQLAEVNFDRGGAIFAIGGGVIGDLAGFVSSIFLRGVDFYQVPTTLLSMVDSSVGGKTGINIPEGKNLVGAFYQPKAVYIDTNFLKTLPDREFSAGMAEVIKYGLLGDKNFFKRFESKDDILDFRNKKFAEVIRYCCRAKAKIVSLDERETKKDGGRALLNLGHTFAHSIENSAGYGKYLHGEAVGIGLLLSAYLSESLGLLKGGEAERVKIVLERYRIPTKLNKKIPIQLLMDAMKNDKKVIAGKWRFIVLSGIGKAVVCDSIPCSMIEDTLKRAL